MSPSTSRPTVNALPIEIVPHVWIPLADGTRLSARLWLPATAAENPVPAVLEYIPYRKNDATAARDNTIHPVFAEAGYAAVRVDMRGCGDSDGVMADEYAQSELDDGLEILEWIANQPWCEGGVGIIGKSWGGFNGLQLAALRPPQLRAIITVCSTDDRYADDVHFNGGVILGSEMLSWASTMLAYNARPADPLVVPDWRGHWQDRLAQSPVYVDTWLAHQRRDAYWKHASVCEDYSAIEVPVLAVGGLYDEYRTTLFRLLENLDSPTQALLGPWAHNYPHQGAPGPAIDFLAEAVRWWDCWMKGVDNGVADQPRLRAFLPESAVPGSDVHERPGRWIAEQSWPSQNVSVSELELATAQLAGPTACSSTAEIGADAGSWLQFGEEAGQQTDQVEDDAKSFTATWPALTEAVEFVGMPSARLRLRSDQPTGQVAVRLCDVGPDGSSRLITAGLLNLTHSESHEFPEALQPGELVDVTVPMLASAHRFLPGHSIRLSVSASYWPWAWPSPQPTVVTLELAEADALLLPTRLATADEYQQAEFRSPPAAPAHPVERLGDSMTKTITRIEETGAREITLASESATINRESGLRYVSRSEDRYVLVPGEPTSAVAECSRVEHLSRDGDGEAAWNVTVETMSRMTGDRHSFFLFNELTAREGDVEVFTQSWASSVPRDLN